MEVAQSGLWAPGLLCTPTTLTWAAGAEKKERSGVGRGGKSEMEKGDPPSIPNLPPSLLPSPPLPLSTPPRQATTSHVGTNTNSPDWSPYTSFKN